MIGNLAVSFMATISFLTIAVYDFLGICRIIGKEEIVEKIWKRLFTTKRYDEKKVFIVIRPLLLYVSMMCFLMSVDVVSKFIIFRLLVRAAPLIALGNMLKKR